MYRMVGTDQIKQTKEWEEAYLDTRRSFRARRKRLVKFDITPKSSVLDLGCGDGLNISILRNMGVKNIIGIDISKYLIEKAKKENPDIKFYIGKAQSLPFRDGRFNVVLVDSVFHHLMKYDRAVKEIHRVLANKGLLCLIEPHNCLPRRLFDYVCLSPAGKLLTNFKNRRASCIEERPLMNHWLRTEKIFYQTLEKEGFRKIFRRNDFLSIIGKYQKI